jgi:hypothetical protein
MLLICGDDRASAAQVQCPQRQNESQQAKPHQTHPLWRPTRATWHQAFVAALDHDTWGQLEEARETYQRLQVAAAAVSARCILLRFLGLRIAHSPLPG